MCALRVEHCVAKEQVEPITEGGRRLIQAALERQGLSRSGLAAKIGKHRSTISRILNGHLRKATVSTLRELERALGLAGKLRAQYELDFEIDEEFAESAQRALRDELSRLREVVGTIRGVEASGIVGLRVHGVGAEERVYQRVFAVRVRRGARS